ncbi:MAG: acetylglutamate kinase [Gemmatimonadota bacterium]|nr:acetylglutamate kinase [Gemmatimonadota bacterium]
MEEKKYLVLKVGGGEVDDPGFLSSLAGVVRSIEARTVIVHGGGKEIGSWLKALGQEARFYQGLRVTDEQAVAVVEMVLSGLVNKRLTGSLVKAGVEALGISGRDLGLVRARKLEPDGVDLGHVGEPAEVRVTTLAKLCSLGLVPVISPVSQAAGGEVFNINADHMAAAMAVALGASEMVFLSNVPGVLDSDGKALESLTPDKIESLIGQGVIASGMVPKVRSALEALEAGVPRVLITNLEGLRKHLAGQPAPTLVRKLEV